MRRKHGVTAEEADEALDDPDQVTLDPDPAGKSGQSVRVMAWVSADAHAVHQTAADNSVMCQDPSPVNSSRWVWWVSTVLRWATLTSMVSGHSVRTS